MAKKPLKDDPVWSILPSYDMFQFTFNGDSNPPDYLDEETTSSSRSCFSSATGLPSVGNTGLTEPVEENSSDSVSSSSVIVADQSTTNWRETILDNINNLRNFSNSDNPISQNIDISVHFTEDVGQIGVSPKLIDPSQFEYKQGDFLNGYVLLKNNSGQPIPFEMFYVLFEGRFTVKQNGVDGSRKENVKTFLEMYDFAASWTPVQVSRLLEEDRKHYECNVILDPLDNSASGINQKIIQPGILYKRFFTFKIPEHLLDTQCNDHNLPSHTLLPPSMGLADEERATWSHKYAPVSDFNFNNSSVSYGVMARFIGKASKFDVLADQRNTKLTDSRGDEFIIFKQATSFLRLILEQNADTEAERLAHVETTRVLYDNLVGRIQERLKKGRELQKAKRLGPNVFQEYIANHGEYSHVEMCTDSHKNRSLYTRFEPGEKNIVRLRRQNDYDVVVPILRPGLLRQPKFQGMFSISSPRTEYVLNYLSPKRFSEDVSGREGLWQMEVPVTFAYTPADPKNARVPEITSVQCELVVFTMETDKYPLPIELSHDLLFQNKSFKLNTVSTDNFLHIVQNPMREYAKELADLAKEVGGSHFKIERSLHQDMLALANARIKGNRLNLREAKLVEACGTVHNLEKRQHITLDKSDDGSFRKKFFVSFNALKAEKMSLRKGPLPADYVSNAEFCLDPSFQTCFLVRMYYLRFIVQLSTCDKVEFKLPLTVKKMV